MVTRPYYVLTERIGAGGVESRRDGDAIPDVGRGENAAPCSSVART